MQNKSKIYTFLSFGLILLFWKLLTFRFSPLVLPTITSVLRALITIISDTTLLSMIGITIVRLFFGLTIGILLGLLIGFLMGVSRIIKQLCLPLIRLFQTIPPVSWVVLALVWFGFNGKPAVFIVITSTLPIIAINVCEGIYNIDDKLMQMASLYQFSYKKKFIHVIFPSILPHFSSAFQVALGSGWKIAVMGEVLTTSDGIGGMIKLARLNIEPDYIIAWSIVIVIVFYLSDFLVKIFTKRRTPHAKSGTCNKRFS